MWFLCLISFAWVVEISRKPHPVVSWSPTLGSISIFIYSIKSSKLSALVSLIDHKMLRFLRCLFLAINIRLGLSGY